MMKFPAIVKPAPDTGGKIAAAMTALSDAEAKLAKLEQLRSAALSDDTDFPAVRKLDGEIFQQRGEVGARRDQIAALEHKLAGEKRAQREREHQAAVDHIATLLNQKRAPAATELASALKAVAAAVEKLNAEVADIRPGVSACAKHAPHYTRDYLHSVLPAGADSVLRDAFGPTVNSDWPMEAKLKHIVAKADEFIAGEAENRARIIAQLRESPIEQPSNPDDNESEAA
jgi:hypothetical protein